MAKLCYGRCKNNDSNKVQYKKWFNTTKVFYGQVYHVQCNEVQFHNFRKILYFTQDPSGSVSGDG